MQRAASYLLARVLTASKEVEHITLQVTKEQDLKSPPKSPPPQSSPADTATFERHLNAKKYKGRIAGAYEWLLELPVVVVLAGMWLAGAALISLFVLACYFLVQLLWMAAGAF